MDLRIFISSTYLDLKDVRARIQEFLSILSSDLISMEFFGSDERRPVDLSLAEVERSNLFLGVYAHRYGTIDPASGLSITELEYNKASELEQAGRLLGLLTYVIEPSASWPVNLVDSPRTRVETFRKRIETERTPGRFVEADDLPLDVLGDVVKRIGLTGRGVFEPRPPTEVNRAPSLTRAIGMEYYAPGLADFFFGRERESRELLTQVATRQMSLLLGPSGIGKTSLINAGLLPAVADIGWSFAVARPLTSPSESLTRSFWSQLLEGSAPDAFDLASVIRAVGDAYGDRTVLLVIDQFEDILHASDENDVDSLVRALINSYQSGPKNVHILISYRGDVEGALGELWQRVTGAAEGLPRLYVHALTEDAGAEVLRQTLSALRLSLSPKGEEERFLAQIIGDVKSETLLAGHDGIYPPFLQMVISRIAADAHRRRFTEEQYAETGGAKEIIGAYLIRQLKFLGADEGIGRTVLIALSSSRGTKIPRDLSHLVDEVRSSSEQTRRVVDRLIDLRLVREVEGLYEIAHDYLAEIVMTELVLSDEREAKKFKELLAARTAAFPQTHTVLTRPEHTHIYRYRTSFVANEDECRLIFESFLNGFGPIAYWLRSVPADRALAWLSPHLQRPLRVTFPPDPIHANAVWLALALGRQYPLDEVSRVFRHYTLGQHLATATRELATKQDLKSLATLARNRTAEVAQAAMDAVGQLIELDDSEVLESLARSRSPTIQTFLREIVTAKAHDLSLQEARERALGRPAWQSLIGIYALAVLGSKADLVTLAEISQRPRIGQLRGTAALESRARLAARLGRDDVLEDLWQADDPLYRVIVLDALDAPTAQFDVGRLLSSFKTDDWFAGGPRLASSQIPDNLALELRLLQEVNPVIAATVMRLASESDAEAIRDLLRRSALTIPGARDLLRALAAIGEADDLQFILERLLDERFDLFLKAPSLLMRDVARLARRSHLKWLKTYIDDASYWSRSSNVKGLRNEANAHLVKRLIGVAYCAAAGRQQLATLRRLLEHPYWTVHNAAARRIAQLGRESDLNNLIEDDIATGSSLEGIRAALVLLDQALYGEKGNPYFAQPSIARVDPGL